MIFDKLNKNQLEMLVFKDRNIKIIELLDKYEMKCIFLFIFLQLSKIFIFYEVMSLYKINQKSSSFAGKNLPEGENACSVWVWTKFCLAN